MSSSESSEHRKIKEIISSKLKEWTGASLQEYYSSGHELDVVAVTPEGISIYVEIIWTATLTNFLKDMNMIQQSDAKIKLVVANPKIISSDEYQREFSKVAVSERRKGFMMYGELINGVRLVEDSDYLDETFKKIVLELIEKQQGKVQKAEEFYEFTPPPIPYAEKIQEELVSNLFLIKKLPSTIFSAPTDLRREEEIIRELGFDIQFIPFFLKNKMIYTFDDLNEPQSLFSSILTQNVVISINTLDWFKNQIQRSDLINLLNRAIKSYCLKQGMKYDEGKERFVHQLKDGKDNVFTWRSGSRYSKRKVAELYYDEQGQALFCRHYAASLRFMFLGDNIYLKIEPTMTFTEDGFRPLSSRRLSRLLSRYLPRQYNLGYLQDVRFWAKYLSRLSIIMSIPAGQQIIEVDANPTITKINRGIKK